MHTATAPAAQSAKISPLEGVTAYHWLVVIIASCGWLFDCMDQRIFTLARQPALKSLLAGDPEKLKVLTEYSGYATAAMLIGWATGGIIFGILSDKIGRVKTMATTLLIYASFTGISGLAHTWVDFFVYRFLAGVGIGGMFGAATALVAESVPGNFRSVALGSLQALSACGNIIGSFVSIAIKPGDPHFLGKYEGWRVLFFIGIVPALLVVPIILVLKEPEAWKKIKAEAAAGIAGRRVGSPVELFRHPRWRHHTIIGLMLGVSGMIGLWGIGFFSPELISAALKEAPQSKVDLIRGWGTAFQDMGAFAGMLTFTFVASYFNRRVAFLGGLLLAMGVTMFVFKSLHTATDAYWMLPIMGFAQLTVFAGYSIYFPELFPTRLRGTGVGFCYNTVRYITAAGPPLLGIFSRSIGLRNAAVAMSSVYLIGMIALIWAPETKGKPLPEDLD